MSKGAVYDKDSSWVISGSSDFVRHYRLSRGTTSIRLEIL